MKRYEVDYGLTLKDRERINFDDLDEAKEYADRNAEHTGYDIMICDNYSASLVCVRKWWSSNEGIELNENPISFGNWGYYSDWQYEGF